MIRKSGKIIFEDSEIDYISNSYKSGVSMNLIAKYFDPNMQGSVIKRVLSERGEFIKGNRVSKDRFNNKYFDIIDSEDKAYWLGFIWSDGNIHKRQRENRSEEYCFKLALSEVDKPHIEKFKKSLSSNQEVKRYKSSGFTKDRNNFFTSEIRIYDRYFCSRLYDDYNLTPYRTEIQSFINNIPEEQIRHFIRGVLDADGSISIYYNDSIKVCVQFTTTYTINEFINNHFISKGLCSTKLKPYIRHKDRDSNCTTINYSGRVQATNILDYLYRSSNISLDRKKDKFLDIVSKKRINTKK